MKLCVRQCWMRKTFRRMYRPEFVVRKEVRCAGAGVCAGVSWRLIAPAPVLNWDWLQNWRRPRTTIYSANMQSVHINAVHKSQRPTDRQTELTWTREKLAGMSAGKIAQWIVRLGRWRSEGQRNAWNEPAWVLRVWPGMASWAGTGAMFTRFNAPASCSHGWVLADQVWLVQRGHAKGKLSCGCSPEAIADVSLAEPTMEQQQQA